MEKKLTLIAPCHFGLESVLKREIQDLGYAIVRVEDGRVLFEGGPEAPARANVFLRTAERVMILAGEFDAVTYDELYEGTRRIPWEAYIPVNGRFWVKKASSVKSALFSPSDIQSIMKKAMVDRLKMRYNVSWFDEDGPAYPVRVAIRRDRVTVGLDTSGASLHKRGYRVSPVIAPVSETLAASLIDLTPWHGDRILVDPFCGSGTFPIEAAMKAARIAPGMKRAFDAESWQGTLPKRFWKEAREEAADRVIPGLETDIQGYDIDPRAIRACRDNARAAGVDSMIHFQVRDVQALSHPKKYGFIITNPPYGERIEDRETVPALYRALGRAYAGLDSWSLYVISSYPHVEQDIGRRADRNRKLYNGMLKTYFYQFQGPKPPRRRDDRPLTETERQRDRDGAGQRHTARDGKGGEK